MGKKELAVVGIPLFILIIVGAYLWRTQRSHHESHPHTVQATAAQPEPPKLKLLNNDPEYDRLRHLNSHDLIDSLPAYRDAVEKRESLIKSKVGNVSDPSLYRTLAEEAGKNIPEINKNDYEEAAETEAQRKKQAYAEAHQDDFFLIGTYENYFPKTQKVIFNLLKGGISEDAEDFSKVNFGAAFPNYPENYTPEEFDRQVKAFDRIFGGGYYGAGVDGPFVICRERYKPDWDEGCADDRHCEGDLLVSVTPEQMDAVYAEVTRLMGALIEKLYAEEMNAGGCQLPSRLTDYGERTGGSYISYAEHPPGKSNIISFVRRQSIFLLGKGDPMDPHHVQVREAYLAVGNKQFAKLK